MQLGLEFGNFSNEGGFPRSRWNAHEFLDNIIINGRATLLKLPNEFLKHLNASGLDFPGEHATSRVFLGNAVQLLIGIEEEAKVLEGNVNSQISAFSPVSLDSLPSTRKGMTINFILDLGSRVGHVNGGILGTGGHFGVVSLEGREEFGADRGGFVQFQAGRDIATQAEIGVLVDGVRDQAGNISAALENVRESLRETGCDLGGWEGNFSDRVIFNESENGPSLIVIDELLNLQDGLVHETKVLGISKDESLFGIESGCDNILPVFNGKMLTIGEGQIFD